MIRFWGKRTSFRKVRIRRPTILAVPGLFLEAAGHGARVQQAERAMPLLRQLLAACRADPFFGFLLPQPEVMRMFLDVYPEEREWIQQLIAQERCAGLPLSASALQEPCGAETHVRMLMDGVSFWETLSGKKPLLQWVNGLPSSCPQWPQLMNQCGILGLVSLAGNGKDTQSGWMEWCSPGNHRIPVYVAQPHYDCSEATLTSMIAAMSDAAPETNCRLLVLPTTWNAPDMFMIGHCRQWGEDNVPVTFSGCAGETFFAARQSAKPASPVHTDQHQILAQRNGLALLTRKELTTALRHIENALYETEAWQSVLHLLDNPVRNSIPQEAWETCFRSTHPHILGGTTHEIHVLDALTQLRSVLEDVHAERTRCLEQIASQVSTSTASNPVSALAFNALPWQHDALIEVSHPLRDGDTPYTLHDYRGNELVYELDPHPQRDDAPARVSTSIRMNSMPPTGFEGITIVDQEPSFPPMVQPKQKQPWMENDHIRVEIDPGRGGGIISLIDRETGKEWINPHSDMPGNTLLWMEERHHPDRPETVLSNRLMEASSDSPVDFQYLEGPLSQRLLIRAAGPGPCTRIQEIRTYTDAPYIDLCTVLEDFGGLSDAGQSGPLSTHRDLYMQAFPLSTTGVVPVVDGCFHSASTTPLAGSIADLLRSDAPDMNLSLTPAQQWADASWSLLFRFVEDSSETGSLAITPSLILAPEKTRQQADSIRRYLSRHAVPCSVLHPGEPALSSRSESMLFCLGTAEQNPATQAILQHDPETAEVFQSRLEQKGSVMLVVRTTAIGSGDRTSTAILLAGRDENSLRSRIEDMTSRTVAHRFDCPASALRIPNLEPIEDAGLAFLSASPFPCGIDSQSLLVVGLSHYAPYQNPMTGWSADFFEQHTIMQRMRIMPHAGDWRVAEVPRRAKEFNHPPRLMPVEAQQGVLSPRETFVSIEPGNMVATSIKPAGLTQPAPPKAQSIVVRAHEAHGEESNLWMDCRQPIKTARALSVLETPLEERRDIIRENQFVRANAHAFEVITLGIDTKAEIRADRKRLPSEERPLMTTRTRSWRMNQVPSGCNRVPLAVVIRGQWRNQGHEHDRWMQHLDVVLSNRSSHQTLTGELMLEATPGIRTLPEQSTFRLQPGGYQVLPVHVIRDAGIKRGLIYARASTSLGSVQDCFCIGDAHDYMIRMTLNRDGFHVHINHPYPYALPGTVQLISPFEAWPEALVGPESITGFTPGSADYLAEPGVDTVVSFTSTQSINPYQIPPDHHWVVVKIGSIQTIRYYHIRLDGRPSEGLGCAFLPPYMAPVQMREEPDSG